MELFFRHPATSVFAEMIIDVSLPAMTFLCVYVGGSIDDDHLRWPESSTTISDGIRRFDVRHSSPQLYVIFFTLSLSVLLPPDPFNIVPPTTPPNYPRRVFGHRSPGDWRYAHWRDHSESSCPRSECCTDARWLHVNNSHNVVDCSYIASLNYRYRHLICHRRATTNIRRNIAMSKR
jgi:hypothetical protein